MDRACSTKAFTEFLVRQQPKYDAAILAEIRPWDPIKSDLRFIKDSGDRRIVSLRLFGLSTYASIARMFRCSAGRIRRRYNKANEAMALKLQVWLYRLPKQRQDKETSKRSGWVGHISYGHFPDSDYQRIIDKEYPDMTKSWPM